MRSYLRAAVAVLFFAAVAPAADDILAGSWKVKLPTQEGPRFVWILQFDQADGKWAGKVVAEAGAADKPTVGVKDVAVGDGVVRLTLLLDKTGTSFEGRIPAEKGKTLYGTLLLSGRVIPIEMEPTALKTLDPWEQRKEDLARATTPLQTFSNALALLAQAGSKKAKPEEVRAWADRAAKAADLYGPRQARDVSIQIAETLAESKEFADVAVSYARRVERGLDEKEPVSTRRRVLQVLATALTAGGKADEAKAVVDALKKIPPIAAAAFAGRKAKSERVVLVELFTGAHCPPCVAAGMATDALTRTYKPSEVVVLSYHLHVPAPDPMTNADTEARAKFYGRAIEGTPTLLLNGQLDPDTQVAGSVDRAQTVYQDLRDAIEPMLEKPTPKVKVTARATRKGNKIAIVAEAAAEDAPERAKLRLALVEEVVTYTGTNKLATHHNVVRALPGGADGVLLKDKTAKQNLTLDLDELRKDLDRYLTDFEKENDKFRGGRSPLELKNLRLVAFVQSDRSGEVVQATQVDVLTE